MVPAPRKRSASRFFLWLILFIAVAVLIVAAVITVPILTHQSAGGSGQALPDGFVAEASAVGADGRTRTLSVEYSGGAPVDMEHLRPGEQLFVFGSGFDASIGIYVSICAVKPDAESKPAPCLGGIPEGAEVGDAAGDDVALSSVWITDDWAWRTFATHGYENAQAGTFEARLLVPDAVQEGLDCSVTRCALTTRADHTALGDRVQDMQLPVAFDVG